MQNEQQFIYVYFSSNKKINTNMCPIFLWSQEFVAVVGCSEKSTRLALSELKVAALRQRSCLQL